MWYYLLALLMIALDQVTKWMVVRYMELGEAIPVLGEFFQIHSSRNRGAAFGILQGQRWFFIVVTLIILAGLIWYTHVAWKQKKHALGISLGLVLGGAVGNFIDRVFKGEVVDFLKFRFQFTFFGKEVDYTFAIFNIADSAITVGVILLGIYLLFIERQEKKEASAHGTDE